MTSPFDELGISDVVRGEPTTRAEAVAMYWHDPVRLQQWLDEQDGLRWVQWDYELRHPGHGDQSVHSPNKGASISSKMMTPEKLAADRARTKQEMDTLADGATPADRDEAMAEYDQAEAAAVKFEQHKTATEGLFKSESDIGGAAGDAAVKTSKVLAKEYLTIKNRMQRKAGAAKKEKNWSRKKAFDIAAEGASRLEFASGLSGYLTSVRGAALVLEMELELRHPGHGDQSVHNPHKGRGAGSGLGEHVPGVKRPGAGDDVPFPEKGSKDYDEFMAGSMREHVVLDAQGNITGFTPERQALHDKIVADHVLGVAPAEGQPELIMMGGGSGAGKSTLLRSGKVDGMPEEGAKTHVMINPDDIKTGENGKTALPEFKERVMGTDKAAGEGAAGFVHEESSYLGKRIQAAAIERRQSIVLDGTGDSSEVKLGGKIADARASGYKVRGVYVTVPTEVAVGRVRTRGATPLYEGANYGRVVADSVTRDIHISVSRVLPKVAEKGLFDSLEVWDNSGGSPVLIFSSAKGGPTRGGLWKGFVAKGFEKLSTEKP